MSAIERAFELAKTGQYASAEEIERSLKGNGLCMGDLQGPDLRKQLKAICDEARGKVAKSALAKAARKPKIKRRPSVF